MSTYHKGVLLVGGPAAGQVVRLAQHMNDYNVAEEPDYSAMPGYPVEKMSPTNIKYHAYILSPFPVRMDDGDPLYMAVLRDTQYSAQHTLMQEYRRVVQENERLRNLLKKGQ
jgi:hypothetical protein